jgi:hypothetical protein
MSQEEPAQTAIIELKKLLCTAPVLAMPQWNKQWIVRTDASITRIGGVLAQEDEHGMEHPVCDYSRTLTPAETRYTVSEMELLAVLACVGTWRHFLWTNQGRKFILWVDHGALLWLHTAKDTEGGGPASRLNRWYLKLCQYNFEVHHKPGKLNVSADFLSRMAGNVEYEKLQRTLPQPEWTQVNEKTANAKQSDKEVATGGATIKEGGRKRRRKRRRKRKWWRKWRLTKPNNHHMPDRQKHTHHTTQKTE